MDNNVDWDNPVTRQRYYAELRKQLCLPGYKEVINGCHEDGETQLKKLLKEIPKEYCKEALDSLELSENYLD